MMKQLQSDKNININKSKFESYPTRKSSDYNNKKFMTTVIHVVIC